MNAQDNDEYRFGFFWKTLPVGNANSNPLLRNYHYDSKSLLDYQKRLLNSVKEVSLPPVAVTPPVKFRDKFDTIRDYHAPEMECFDFDDSSLTVIFDENGNVFEELSDQDIISSN